MRSSREAAVAGDELHAIVALAQACAGCFKTAIEDPAVRRRAGGLGEGAHEVVDRHRGHGRQTFELDASAQVRFDVSRDLVQQECTQRRHPGPGPTRTALQCQKTAHKQDADAVEQVEILQLPTAEAGIAFSCHELEEAVEPGIVHIQQSHERGGVGIRTATGLRGFAHDLVGDVQVRVHDLRRNLEQPADDSAGRQEGQRTGLLPTMKTHVVDQEGTHRAAALAVRQQMVVQVHRLVEPDSAAVPTCCDETRHRVVGEHEFRGSVTAARDKGRRRRCR